MEIVAEFTYNHFGDSERAMRMIDAAKKSNATCVKFEMRNVENYFRNYPEIRNRRGIYEFSDRQIELFAEYCKKKKIDWFATVHDLHSLNRVMPFNPKYLKVASREARSIPFLKKIKEKNKGKFPIIISTGAMRLSQIEKVYALMKNENLTIVHTACQYPCNVEDLNISRVSKLMEMFPCKIGYSGHEEGFIPSLYAAVLGVNYIERHFTLEEKNKKVAKGIKNFKDELCSLSPEEFKKMVAALKTVLKLKQQKLNNKVSLNELDRVNAYGVLSWDGNDVFLK